MLKIYKYKGTKCYIIQNKYLNESGILNERNVRNALKKYRERKSMLTSR